jgi:glutamyl-tRNA synthetase
VFQDVVKGEISFDNSLLEDFVIVKSSGIPVYNFAVMIDDHVMEISHVIRGDDHVSNTPRQILLYKAFGWNVPIFAHIPMILGSDGARLSKRHGATSVLAYRDEGFLPEALRNYLSLLGWSTEDSQQLFTYHELIEKFSLERCSPSAAIFDPAKLLWMNGEYIRHKNPREFYELVRPLLVEKGLLSAASTPEQDAYAQKVVTLEQEKMKLLTDVPRLVDFMLGEVVYDEDAVNKVLRKEGAAALLQALREKIKTLEPFTPENIEALCKQYAQDNGLKNGQVFHPLRVATSGRTQGPSLFHYLEVLGKEKVLERIDRALAL